MSAAARVEPLESLGGLLRTRVLGRAHEHHESLDSTNDRLGQWAREGAPHGAVVTADLQRAGRGRRGRSWSSQGQNLYASLLLRPGALPAGSPLARDFGALGLVVGLGLAKGLEPLLTAVSLRLDLKWPNDLMVGGRKLAGILCESRWLGASPEVVVGFGVNVHQLEFDPLLCGGATSLAASGVSKSRADVLARVLLSLEQVLAVYLREGFLPLRKSYHDRCPMIGEDVTLDEGRGPRQVRVLGIDHDGALEVQDTKGQRRVCVGDVTRIRRV